jgi:hypothetical protein
MALLRMRIKEFGLASRENETFKVNKISRKYRIFEFEYKLVKRSMTLSQNLFEKYLTMLLKTCTIKRKLNHENELMDIIIFKDTWND